MKLREPDPRGKGHELVGDKWIHVECSLCFYWSLDLKEVLALICFSMLLACSSV